VCVYVFLLEYIHTRIRHRGTKITRGIVTIARVSTVATYVIFEDPPGVRMYVYTCIYVARM